jgi:hypothetical protein
MERAASSWRRRGLWCAIVLVAAIGGSRARAQSAGDDELPVLSAVIGAGAGAASRLVHYPNASGVTRLSTAAYPAMDLHVGAGVLLTRKLSVDAWVLYRTSVGLHVSPPGLNDEDTSRVPLRADDVRFGAGPGIRILRAPVALSVRLGVGWMFRGLRAVTVLAVPAYTLQGPLFRPELRAEFESGAFAFTIAPELLALFASGAARNGSGAAQPGIGAGGEVSLDVRVIEALHLVLSYRGSYARFASAYPAHFIDVDHGGTLRAELHF